MKKLNAVLAAILFASASQAMAMEHGTESSNQFAVSIAKYKADRSFDWGDGSWDGVPSPDSGITTDSMEHRKYGFEYVGTKAFDADWFIRLGAKLSYGSQDGVIDGFGDAFAAVGFDFPFAGTVFSPYVGFGGRYALTDNEDEGFNLTQTTEKLYVPLGVTHHIYFGGDSGLETTFEYDFVVSRQEASDFDVDTMNGGTAPMTLDYSGAGGYGLKIATVYRISNFFVGPYYEYWQNDEINMGVSQAGGVAVGGLELKGSNAEAGIKFGLRF